MEIVDEEIAARSFPFALVKLCTMKNAQMVLMFTIHSGLSHDKIIHTRILHTLSEIKIHIVCDFMK